RLSQHHDDGAVGIELRDAARGVTGESEPPAVLEDVLEPDAESAFLGLDGPAVDGEGGTGEDVVPLDLEATSEPVVFLVEAALGLEWERADQQSQYAGDGQPELHCEPPETT